MCKLYKPTVPFIHPSSQIHWPNSTTQLPVLSLFKLRVRNPSILSCGSNPRRVYTQWRLRWARARERGKMNDNNKRCALEPLVVPQDLWSCASFVHLNTAFRVLSVGPERSSERVRNTPWVLGWKSHRPSWENWRKYDDCNWVSRYFFF